MNRQSAQTRARTSPNAARTDRTGPGRPAHTVRVSSEKEWPHAVFLAWLDSLKDSLGVRSDSQLAERVGIPSPSVINGWRKSERRRQPSVDNLRKLATAAGIPPVQLYRIAGRVEVDDIDGPPLVPADVLPRSIQRLIDLYRSADDSTRTVLLGQVDFLVEAIAGRAH